MDNAALVEIFTDGACRGNPGPGGWGVLIRRGPEEQRVYGAEADTTNNRMELMAAIRGLESLPEPAAVRVVTDSQYVRNGIADWLPGWMRRNWRTAAGKPVKNVDLWQRLVAAADAHEVRWEWVRGHSGHAENEEADRLANQAIDEMLSAGGH
ncbi:MAG: ribonuclease HI [Gammaproteobacteria bacterium]|nr:ribonuclease HI [Gammaproteobacteria bacterium]